MVILVLLVAVIGLLCYGFYSWAHKQGLTGGEAHEAKEERAGHISLLTEAVSYVGVILVLAGGIAAIARRWAEISDWGHVGVFAGAAALFLMVGAVLFKAGDPALQRVVDVVWFVSVAGVAGAAGFAAQDVYDKSAQLTALLVGICMAAYSAVLWLLRKHAAQNVALFVSLIVTICATIATIAHGNAPSLAFTLSLWVFGLTWVLAGWRRWVEPMWASVPLGLLLALVAPAFALEEHGWVYAIALATAVAVLAVSVPLRNTPMLAMGTIGLFGYVTSMVIRYFADSLGAPTALALTGAVILVLAAVNARLLTVMNKPQPDKGEPDKPTDDKPSGRHLTNASQRPVAAHHAQLRRWADPAARDRLVCAEEGPSAAACTAPIDRPGSQIRQPEWTVNGHDRCRPRHARQRAPTAHRKVPVRLPEP